ncbi:MAG: SDR family oxidoreductase [Lachnospiraceae bacterium]|nr:SDR family oxidoreductase [Lachnospiraceae bacterium]
MATACITGASSGIGREFARQLSAQGFDLILVARSENKLKEVAAKCNTDCEVFVCDLSRTEECNRLLAYLSDREIAMFINNAGFGNIGLFEENDIARDLEMIDVNVRAMHILAHGILKQMKKRDRGYLLNVASVAGLMPGGPLMATYYATKAYVVSLTNAIAEELNHAESRVRVFALCPGPVDTEFNDVAGVKFSLPGISARNCVRACLKDMRKGKTVIVPGLTVRALQTGAKFMPRKMLMKVLMKGQKKKLEK